MPSTKALQVATQCWCEDSTKSIEMDTVLAREFAKKIDEYIAALEWCGDTAQFGLGCQCLAQWKKRVAPLLETECL